MRIKDFSCKEQGRVRFDANWIESAKLKREKENGWNVNIKLDIQYKWNNLGTQPNIRK